MNDKRSSGGSRMSTEDLLERLFEHSRPRLRPPEEDERLVREALYLEWDTAMKRRGRVRRLGWMAMAASVVVAVGMLSVLVRPGFVYGTADLVAQVQRLDGDIRVENTSRGSESVSVAGGSELLEGYLITTGEGQVTLALSEGGELRLATRSAVRLVSSAEVELVRGALYFDSDNGERTSGEFAVRTAAGTLRHVGTQFMARRERGTVEVSVREGEVAVDRDNEENVVVGERAIIPEGGGGIRRETIAVYGDEWDWVDRMAPVFDIDGNTLLDYLIWVARETGRQLEFETPEAERGARATILHGSIDMEPLPMLSAVMATTALEYSLLGNALHISIP